MFFGQLAAALNDAGLDMRKTLKQSVEIPWSGDRVKEFLWRPIQRAVVEKTSTTELDTRDPSEVYEILNRHLAQKFGIHVPFPSWETLAEERRDPEAI